MRTIEGLRKIAELNLCEDCFKKYKALIEPNVKNWLFKPLIEWRWVESYITQIVMKTEGIFKGEAILISFEEGEESKVADEVDVKAFRKIKKCGFKRKIDFLRKNGILRDSSYRLLDKAREVRNKIHDEPTITELTEQDYVLFHVASEIALLIWNATMYDWKEDISTDLKSRAEKTAERWLPKIDNF